jgi:hypothetical protein
VEFFSFYFKFEKNCQKIAKKYHQTFETTKWKKKKKKTPVDLIPVKPTQPRDLSSVKTSTHLSHDIQRYHGDKTKNITRQFEKWNAHNSKHSLFQNALEKQQKLLR